MSLQYLANRLSNRHTYLQYNDVVMGSIKDSAGAEQGGLLSSDEFQLVNNEELDLTNNAGLGLDMGGIQVGSIGAADDILLASLERSAL